MAMDERKQRVLRAIVSLYSVEGEPVGSSVLANYFDMAVSSATLRNEMAALEDEGFITHPHTSAGRVPSNRGYRYYVSTLMGERELTRGEQEYRFTEREIVPNLADWSAPTRSPARCACATSAV